MEQKTGAFAGAAMVAAVLSYLAICTGHPGWGLVAGLLSLPLGLIGFFSAASARVSGGIMSIFAMLLGIVAVVLSILGLVGALVLNLLD